MSSQNLDNLYLDARRKVLLGLTLYQKCINDGITENELKSRKQFLVQNGIVENDCDLQEICDLNLGKMSNKQLRRYENRCKDRIKYDKDKCNELDINYHSDCNFTENILPKSIKVYYNNLSLDVLKGILGLTYAQIQTGDKKILLKCIIGRIKYQNNCLPFTKDKMTKETNMKHQYFIEVLYLAFLLTQINPEKINEYISRINGLDYFLKPVNRSKFIYNPSEDNFSFAKELLEEQLENIDQIQFLCNYINKIIEKDITVDILLQLNSIETEVRNLYSQNQELKDTLEKQVIKEESESEEESTYIPKPKAKKSKGKKGKKSEQNEEQAFKEINDKTKLKQKEDAIKQEKEIQIEKLRISNIKTLISTIQNTKNIGKVDKPKIDKLIDFINELPELNEDEFGNKNIIPKDKFKIALEKFENISPPNKKIFERAVNYFNNLVKFSELYFNSPFDYTIFENIFIPELGDYYNLLSFDLLIYLIVYYLYFFVIQNTDKNIDFSPYSIIPGILEEKEINREKTPEEIEAEKEHLKNKNPEEINAEKAKIEALRKKFLTFNENMVTLMTGIMLDSYKKQYIFKMWLSLDEENKRKLRLLRKFIIYFLDIKYS